MCSCSLVYSLFIYRGGRGADKEIAGRALSNLLTHVWVRRDRRGHRKMSKNQQGKTQLMTPF